MGDEAKRIALVVDDSPEIQVMLTHLLEHYGYTVLTASDGHEALKILEDSSHIDLLITDQEMPGARGIPLLQKIIQKMIPVQWLILFTGLPTTDPEVLRFKDEIQVLGLGHVRIFFKGGDPSALEDFTASL